MQQATHTPRTGRQCGLWLRLAKGVVVGFVTLVVGVPALAQLVPAANAVKLPDSLVFVNTAAISNASLVWHPVFQRYYSLRPGAAGFPLETWMPSGGLSISQTTTGIDTRGLWYNPSTAQVERNCFSALGWATLPTDASLNATSGFTTLFAGMVQPNVQSLGAYEPSTNSVLFYSVGTLEVYSRATGTLTATIPLTGAVLTNVAQYCVFYTGQVGYEVALYDCIAKRVLFFNRNTGAFTGQSQLPASAIATSTATFRFGYTNNKFWLFNASLRKWNAYCIWNGTGCPAFLLPVEMLDMKAHCAEGSPALSWSTGSERNSSHFAVERSTNAQEWATAGRVEAAGNSQQLLEYTWTDPEPVLAPVVYYRLRQVDLDGTQEAFDVLPLVNCAQKQAWLQAFPNPTTDVLHVITEVPTNGAAAPTLDLIDPTGRIILSRRLAAAEGRTTIDLELRHLDVGTYALQLKDATGGTLQHTAIVKE